MKKILLGDAINALIELSKKLGELDQKLTVSSNTGIIEFECSSLRNEYEEIRRATDEYEKDPDFDSWDQRVLNTLERIESEISLPPRDRKISKIGRILGNGSKHLVLPNPN